MKQQNILYFLQFFLLIGMVGFYSWEITKSFGFYQFLWIVIPGGIFSLLFLMAFESLFNLPYSIFYIVKKIMEYFLAACVIFLFNHILLLFLNLFLDYSYSFISIISLSLSVLMLVYGYHQGQNVIVKKMNLESSKIKEKYTFLQLSDIHIGSNGRKEIQNILNIIKPISFDFVIITGDLIDEDYADYHDLQLLSEISEPIYYITGNHEYTLRDRDVDYFIEKTDIHDINDRKISFNELDIYGVDENSDVSNVLEKLDFDNLRCSLCLIHEPYCKKIHSAEGKGIDFVFSGHTHNGQFFPLTLFVPFMYRFLNGIYHLGKTILYVSAGTGTWGPKIRLGTQNEVTLITLMPKK